MKKRFVAAWLLATMAGGALHFAYPLCQTPLVGLFAPVNESVWEHLKLFFWPMLLAAFVLTRGAADGRRAWSGWLLGLLRVPLLCIGAYYALSCGLGIEAMWIDIALYAVLMADGFYTAYRKTETGRAAWAAGPLVIAVGLYGAALILFSMAPPALPIFMD